jgi:hypothetical protein
MNNYQTWSLRREYILSIELWESESHKKRLISCWTSEAVVPKCGPVAQCQNVIDDVHYHGISIIQKIQTTVLIWIIIPSTTPLSLIIVSSMVYSLDTDRVFNFLLLFLVGWNWVHLVLRPLLAYRTSARWSTRDGDCGAIGRMKNGWGNRSTQRKPAPMPVCPPQIPRDQTRVAVVGSQRLTAWAMARPTPSLNYNLKDTEKH